MPTPRSPSPSFATLTALAGLAVAATAGAQRLDLTTGRFELGLRLQRMERALAANPSPDAVRRVRDPLVAAVQAFFRGDVPAVAETLVRCRWLLEENREPTQVELAAASLCLRPARRMVDRGTATLTIEALHLFAENDVAPELERSLRADLELVPIGGGAAISLAAAVAFDDLPSTTELALPKLAAGEYGLRAIVRGADGLAFATEPVQISIAENGAARIEALERAYRAARATADDEPNRPDPTTVASLDHSLRLLRRLERGGDETGHPATTVLEHGEQMARALAAGRPWLGPGVTGDLRVRLDTEAGQVVARLAVPEGIDPERPTALVIGLHGAGGSENMMFDVHGEGLGPRLAQQRGWLFLAPITSTRPGALVAAVDELAARYPIDRARVFAFGHSMGAAATATLYQHAPDRFAAIAMLGGGGAVRDREALARVPLLVAVGDADFLRRGALDFVRAVQRGGDHHLTLRELEDVEHLAVVQLALPEVFAHFDRASGGR